MLAIIIIVSLLFWTGLADLDPIAFSDISYTTYPSLNPFISARDSYPDAIFDDKTKQFCVYHVPLPDEYNRNPGVYADCSGDLKTWQGQGLVLNITGWSPPVKNAIVSVAATAHKGSFYLFISTTITYPNYDNIGAAIFVVKEDNPYGPFTNPLPDSEPLVGFPYTNNKLDARPNPSVVKDSDGHMHLFYTSASSVYHYNLTDNLLDIGPGMRKDVTPMVTNRYGASPSFSEGVKVFVRETTYYMLWKDSSLEGASDTPLPIRYAISHHPEGLFVDSGRVLEPDPAVVTKLGHATVINIPTTDIWYLIYFREFSTGSYPYDRSYGIVYDRMYFVESAEKDKSFNTIKPVQMGVKNDFDHGLQNWQPNGGRSQLFSFGSWSEGDEYLSPNSGPHQPDDRYYHTSADPPIEASALMYNNFGNFIYDIQLVVPRGQYSFGDAGVMFRVANNSGPFPGVELWYNPDNYWGYYAGIRLDGRVVLGMANGTWNELMVSETVFDMNHNKIRLMRVWAVGHQLKVYVDDLETAMIDVTDETYQTGRTGLRSFRAYCSWDNMEIRKL